MLEIPAASENASITGSIDDGWQTAIEDVGPAGVDKGKGAAGAGQAILVGQRSTTWIRARRYRQSKRNPRCVRCSSLRMHQAKPPSFISVRKRPRARRDNGFKPSLAKAGSPTFRIYGPEKPAFDGSWKPGDFEKVK